MWFKALRPFLACSEKNRKLSKTNFVTDRKEKEKRIESYLKNKSKSMMMDGQI